jgi:hypothetical protein
MGLESRGAMIDQVGREPLRAFLVRSFELGYTMVAGRAGQRIAGNAVVNGIGSNGHRSRFTAASCRNINLGYVA